MNIFERINNMFATKQVNTDIFGYLQANEAPSMKAIDYVKAYKGWVYSCTNAIADEVASMQLHLQRKTGDTWVEADDNIVTRLLKDVNDFNTFHGLLIQTASFLELEGNGFWYLPRGEITNKPAEIWFLNPTQVTVIKSSETFISGYKYKTGRRKEVFLTPDEVIQFKTFNPLSKYRGMGTVQASALAIDVDDYSQRWNKNFFYNSAMPSALLETDEELTKEQYDRLKQEWKSRYTGLSNSNKLAILQGGLKYKPAQISQKDMEFLNQRKFSRDEILAIFRTPKTIIGITEDVNRANAETSEYVFAKRVIKPKMQIIVDNLNEFLLPMFDLDINEWRFVFDNPVPQNRELELKEYENGVKNYWLTSNEIRETEGLEPVSGGDSIYVPFSLYPIGSVQDREARGVKPKTKQRTERQENHLKQVKARRVLLATETEKHTPDWIKLYKAQYEQVAKRLDELKDPKSVKTKKQIKSFIDDAIALIFITDKGDLLKFQDQAAKTLTSAFVKGGKQSIADLDLDNPFNVGTVEAEDWLAENTLLEAKTVMGTQKKEMSKVIADGINSGKTTSQIADDIRRLKNDTSKFKADRIARTEVTKAYSNGVINGWKQTGVANFKEWVTVGDDRVGPDCFENEQDGPIPVSEAFSSGAFTPADEHPNCRCLIRGLTGSEFNFRTQEEANRITKKETAKLKVQVDKQLVKSKKLLNKEAKIIIGTANKDAKKIVSDAKKEAKKEKGKIIGDLAKIRDEGLKQLYE